jgi:SAM-dependent methyltransferase
MACEANADALTRCLRVLVDEGLFREDEDHGFHLAGAGEWLLSDGASSWWSFAVLAGELAEPTPAAALFAARTGRAAFDHSHGFGLYDALAENPDAERMFSAAMSANVDRLRDAIFAAVDWSDVHHVVDIGGSHGALLAALLQRLPNTTGVLFDQPHVIAGAGRTLTAAGVEERVDCVGGDFYDEVPPGGDLYLLSNVVWNLPDAQAARLVRRCAEAMSPSARLVVIEPMRCDDHPVRHILNSMDLANFWVTGGHVRSADEWRELLRIADMSVLSLTPTASDACVLQAAPIRSGGSSTPGRTRPQLHLPA